MIKALEAGLTVAEVCRKYGIHWPTGECAAIADRQPCQLLQAEGQVRWQRRVGCPASEAAQGRKRKAQAAGRGYDAGRGGAERLAGKALTTPAQRREAVIRAMRDHNISQRRICDLVGVDPKTVLRDRPPDHADIRKKVHVIPGTRRRFGYQRVGILHEREGCAMSRKKLFQLYRGKDYPCAD